MGGSQCQKKLGIFRGGANGNANRFGKAHPAHGPNNDAFEEEFVAERLGVGADGDKEKIRFAGNGRIAKFAELVEQALPFVAIGFHRELNMLGIVQSGEGGGLADAGDVERSAELVHFGDKRRVTDAVADPQSSETVDLGESTKCEDVVVFTEEFARSGKIGAGSVFEVGLIENDKDVTGNFPEESSKFMVAERGASGIVGIGNIDDAGIRSDGGRDSVEIERVIAHGRLDEMAAGRTNGDGKEGECAFAGDAVEARAQKDAGGEVNDFAGTEADKDFFEADVVAHGENFAETFATSVGIPVSFTESTPGGIHGFGRRAEWIFIGSKFDSVDLEILLHFFDGLPGNVGWEALNVVRDELFESVRHEIIL